MVDFIVGLCLRDLSGDLGAEGEVRVEKRGIISGVWLLYGWYFGDGDVGPERSGVEDE